MSGLIWVQSVCKGYQQTTLVGKELKYLSSAGCFLEFFLNFFKKFFQADPDQARHYVSPDLGPNCLQSLSADDTSR